MYFTDRVALGRMLADPLMEVKGKDAIVVCLKESALLTCFSLAVNLRAIIFPLIYQTVKNPDDPTTVLGALDQNAEFSLNPKLNEADFEYIQQEFRNEIEEFKREAMHDVNQLTSSYNTQLDRSIMNGRDVILAGDIITSELELAVVEQLFKPLRPARVLAVAGNVTPAVSDSLHMASDQATVLDVLTGIVFEDSHYFQNVADPYSPEQKRALVLNVTTYWQ